MESVVTLAVGEFAGEAGWLLTAYCVLIILGSLAGGFLPNFIELTHTRMQTILSFVGGMMLGVGVLHMLPHAAHELGSTDEACTWMMVGIVVMFVMLRLFHFHNHEPVKSTTGACEHDHDHDVSVDTSGIEHGSDVCHSHGHSHGLSWMGIAIGLSVHTMIDGIALGASVFGEAADATAFGLFAMGTFLAIVLHKPLDAVSITSLMVAGGWKSSHRTLVNAGFALMCPLGAMLFGIGIRSFPGIEEQLLGTALAFSSGVFICIALSDLLPEMEFHTHNRIQLTLALAIGLALSWLLTHSHPH